MKNLIRIIFIFNCVFFISFNCYPQSIYTNLFKYKYEFKLDSAGSSKFSENMFLITNENESYFLSASNYRLDSIKATNEYQSKSIQGQLAVSSKYPTRNDYYIYNNILKNEISYNEFAKVIPEIRPEYKEIISIKWNLSNERKNINGYNCQKATTKLFGRYWTAWYTSSIPLPYGPYKFSALPGLIIKIEDKTGTHSFTLYSHEKTQRKFPLKAFEFLSVVKKQKAIELINKGKYTTALYDGLKMSDPTFIKDLQKRKDEQRKKENNPIELQINP